MIAKVTVFIAFSLLIFRKFGKNLGNWKCHDAYMFPAVEGLLLLFILNGENLFEAHVSVRQMLSWVLTSASAIMAVSAFLGLKKYGRAATHWEHTTRLVREGIFKYIRHPLYASLMLLALGICLKDVSLWAALTCFFTVCFLTVASLVEEKENEAKFGEEYRDYALNTKRYLPFII